MAAPTQRRATPYPAFLARKPRAIPTGIGSKCQSSNRVRYGCAKGCHLPAISHRTHARHGVNNHALVDGIKLASMKACIVFNAASPLYTHQMTVQELNEFTLFLSVCDYPNN